MACKYCGRDADGRVDQYEEDECAECAMFFENNPEIPGFEEYEEIAPGMYRLKSRVQLI